MEIRKFQGDRWGTRSVLAAFLAVAPFTSAAGAAPQGTAATALKAWKSSFKTAKSQFPKGPDKNDFARELKRRVAIDQAARESIPDEMLLALPKPEKGKAETLIYNAIEKVDNENVLFLKKHLPADGWFKISRDGASVASDAWVIVQHAHDENFQLDILKKIEPLVAVKEANGEDYALLFDRIQVSHGKPQRFGSQIGCIAGKFSTGPIEDPRGLDERRARVGLKPFKDYFAWWQGKSC